MNTPNGAVGGHGADFLSKVGDGGANELVGGRVFLPKDRCAKRLTTSRLLHQREPGGSGT